MDQGAISYQKYLNGDDEGIVEIVRDYKDGLMLFVNRYVHNIHTAEDITEETFFKLITKKPKFVAEASFKTWLYTIGRNEALNVQKRMSRFSDTPTEDMSEVLRDEGMIEDQYLEEERKRELYKAMAELKEDYAQVLHLSYLEGMSNEDTARIMKKTKRQVENLLYKAKGALKKKLSEGGFVYENV